jgi:DNA (cytosine-5)-methyltransferase 1
MNFSYGSVCSGIEAATVAWHPLGWKPAWFSEIEEFPSRVLAHHYQVENCGDMTKIYEKKTFKKSKIDLLVGGTPCQSFSLAGSRGGLNDPRGDLALEFLRIAKAAQPRWFVWENVPGVMSSSEGRDFGIFLRNVQKCGYGFAYRVLDAQYFGVPQRRRRLFVVGHLGDWRPAAEVLFDGQNRNGDSSPCGVGETVGGTPLAIEEGATGSEGGRVGRKASTIKAGYYKCYNDRENWGNLVVGSKDGKTTIRRLTPVECERLQGFDAGYTAIPNASDSKRYKAIGNSMAVPVMRWIGERIEKVETS